jgi:hypothetical protein
VNVGEARHADAVFAALEAEHFGQRRFAFENQDGALLDAAVHSADAGAPARATKTCACDAGWRSRPMETEDVGPGAGIVGEDRKVRQQPMPDVRRHTQGPE